MKKKIFSNISIYLGVILLLTNACNDDFGAGEPIDYKNTVKEKIDTDPTLSFYKELYQFHDSLLNSVRPDVIAPNTRIPTMGGTLGSSYITAFIPTNDVFIANGINSIKVNGTLNPGLFKFINLDNRAGFTFTTTTLARFLGNFIVNRPVENADFSVLTRLRTLAGTPNDSLFISSVNSETILNFNGKVNISSRANYKNGSLYTVTNLFVPAFQGQFIQAIAVDTTLSLFSQALVRANPPSATEPLINGSANTPSIRASVFAPTNQAFRDAGITSASITAMPLATLRLLVQNHIIRQRIFSPQLVTGTLTMINSRPITLNVSGSSVTITSPGSVATPATIVSPDILVIRGVIHKVNKVLRP